MAFKYFELAMVIVSVLGRIAGTVAIVWLIVTRLADGFFTPLLVLLVTYFGLGFQMSYNTRATSPSRKLRANHRNSHAHNQQPTWGLHLDAACHGKRENRLP